jgi:hypothetical protein
MRNLSLANLQKFEIKKNQQSKLKASGLTDPEPDGAKCVCLCAPETDKGYKEVLKKNQ